MDITPPSFGTPIPQEPAPLQETSMPSAKKHQSYFPFYETLRLYAGWLLAWYGLVYAVGAYQYLKPLPFRIPYAESLFLSPLVLSFTFAAYLFLLGTTVAKILPKFPLKNIVLLVTGIAAFVLYRMNLA